jgi:choline-sulfatase
MKRRGLAVLLGFLLVLAAVLSVRLLRRPAPAFLQRVPFTIVSGDPLRYDTSQYHWLSGKTLIRPGQAISDGRGVAFSRSAELQATPRRSGNSVIFFSYSIMPLPEGSIRFSALLRNRGRETMLRSLEIKERASGYISAVANLAHGDAIILRAAGRGFLIAGRAVISAVAEPERRQYVFVVAPDNFRGDRLEKRGPTALHFAHLEEFARDAVVFENAVAPSSWTLPSFASVFSGQYEFRHQVTPQAPLSPDQPHLLSSLVPRFVTVQFNDGVWMSAKMGFARNHDLFIRSSRAKDVYADRRLFANAREFLQANPFPGLFMFLHTYKLHSPFEPGKEFFAALRPEPRRRWVRNFSGQAQFKSHVPPEERREMEALYDAEVLQFDHFFGGFLRDLKRAGIYERSLIVLLSDHGEEFGEHGGWFHGHSLYREMVHVPFFIKFPERLYAGRRIRESVSICDALPTVLDQLHIAPPPGVDGISLLPLIRGERLRPRIVFSSATVSLFNSHLPQQLSLFSGPYHLIVNLPRPPGTEAFYREYGRPPARPEIELYDMRSDPGERREISGRNKKFIDSLRPEIVRILKLIREHRPGVKFDKSLLDEEQETLRTLGYL